MRFEPSMKIVHVLIGTFVFLFAGGIASLPAEPLPGYSRGYDPARDPFEDGKHAVSLATATQRHILIEVGGDWCSWCLKLDRFLKANRDIEAGLHQTFVLLKVNVSEENDNAEFLSAFPRILGYPHMFVADSEGKVLHSQDPAEFLEQGEYSRTRFLRFLETWSQ